MSHLYSAVMLITKSCKWTKLKIDFDIWQAQKRSQFHHSRIFKNKVNYATAFLCYTVNASQEVYEAQNLTLTSNFNSNI